MAVIVVTIILLQYTIVFYKCSSKFNDMKNKLAHSNTWWHLSIPSLLRNTAQTWYMSDIYALKYYTNSMKLTEEISII